MQVCYQILILSSRCIYIFLQQGGITSKRLSTAITIWDLEILQRLIPSFIKVLS